MTHHHKHHHEHHHAISSLNSIFIACIVINLAFVFIEAGVGFIYNSLGLLSDAGHNLSDVFSLLLSLFAFRMSQYHSNRHFTYGYKKSTVLVSLVNAIILLIAVGAIVIESFYKLKHPEATSGEAISWTAGIGSRFGTGIKQLEPVDASNHIIMDYSIHDAIEAGFNHVVFIIRKDIEKEFKEVIGDRIASICKSHNVTVDYAFQDINDIPGVLPEGRTKPWGTGQAVLASERM